jgi:hypothetical protein
VQELVRKQGVPAAATWAIASRPAGRLSVESLGEQLSSAYDESAGMLTNGDLQSVSEMASMTKSR